MSQEREVHQYQAEMKKLLDILIHSLYTEREIFLRELISNASDALSKIQFISLTEQDILDKDAELQINLEFDDKEKTITITDNGVGMTHDEVINNLGTIASSGTLKFLSEMKDDQKRAENLIGQFGVGFYSVFMVASKVELFTRSYKADSQAWLWTSDGSGSYEMEPVEKTDRGTKIVIHLKEECLEYAAQFKLKNIVKKYSDFIPFPVKLKGETANQVKALWTLPRNEIKQEDYNEFYKQISHDFQEPLHTMHFVIDAPIQYYAVLFIPSDITNEVLYARESTGIKLYAQRVFIQGDNKNLLPPYLRFVRGVIDSEDIPLNVSRESVQHSALIEKIKKNVVNRFLKELESIANSNTELYAKFWSKFSALIKEGVTSDFPNKDRLKGLLRFNSTMCENAETTVSLKDYVARMRDEQKEIYYAVGPSRDALLLNPNMEYFKKNSLEVLLLFESIDDFLMNDLREFDGKQLKSISNADIDAKDDQPENEEEKLNQEDSDAVVGFIKNHLMDKVKDVVPSKRLVGSPCSLINTSDGMSAHMEKMMKMVNKEFEISKRNLEVNMQHKIIKNMAEMIKKDKNSPVLRDMVDQLFQSAMLVEGLLDNPLEMLPRVYKFMEDSLDHHLKA